MSEDMDRVDLSLTSGLEKERHGDKSGKQTLSRLPHTVSRPGPPSNLTLRPMSARREEQAITAVTQLPVLASPAKPLNNRGEDGKIKLSRLPYMFHSRDFV